MPWPMMYCMTCSSRSLFNSPRVYLQRSYVRKVFKRDVRKRGAKRTECQNFSKSSVIHILDKYNFPKFRDRFRLTLQFDIKVKSNILSKFDKNR